MYYSDCYQNILLSKSFVNTCVIQYIQKQKYTVINTNIPSRRNIRADRIRIIICRWNSTSGLSATRHARIKYALPACMHYPDVLSRYVSWRYEWREEIVFTTRRYGNVAIIDLDIVVPTRTSGATRFAPLHGIAIVQSYTQINTISAKEISIYRFMTILRFY